MPFAELKKRLEKKKNLNIERIERAYNLAEKVHSHQKRRSGEPYIIHPITVTAILFDAGAEEDTICASLLHDTIEDFRGDKHDLEVLIYNNFGSQVFYLVQAVSKDGDIEDKDIQQEIYFTQIEQAMKTDLSVFFIKIADLIHNLSTIGSLKKEKQDKWMQELKYEYIPLFCSYGHSIPIHYRNTFQYILNKLQTIIKEYDTIQESNLQQL